MRRPDPRPGDIWIANIVDRVLNPHHTSKPRPAVVVGPVFLREQQETGVLVAGFTSHATYANGYPRVPVPAGDQGNISAAGFRSGAARSFLWGGRLVALPTTDLVKWLCPASMDLVARLGRVHGLTGEQAAAMLPAPSWARALDQLHG